MPVISYNPIIDNKSIVLWDNYLERGNIQPTAGGEVEGHPAINVSDPATYNFWVAPNVLSATLTFDLLTPSSINAIAISAHTVYSSGSTLEFMSSVDGVNWYIEFSYTPADDEDLLFVFPNLNYRYYRLNFTGGTPAIGYVSVGSVLVFPCTPIDNYTPTHHSRKYEKQFTTSIKGHFLGNRVMSAGMQATVEFPSINRDFVDGPLIGFEDHYNRGGTFFFAGWPGGKPQDMSYCRAGSESDIVNVTYVEGEKLADLSFSLDGYVSS